MNGRILRLSFNEMMLTPAPGEAKNTASCCMSVIKEFTQKVKSCNSAGRPCSFPVLIQAGEIRTISMCRSRCVLIKLLILVVQRHVAGSTVLDCTSTPQQARGAGSFPNRFHNILSLLSPSPPLQHRVEYC